MTFNKCSIGGRAYGDVFDLRTGDIVEITEVSISDLFIDYYSSLLICRHKNIFSFTSMRHQHKNVNFIIM